jgi:hypothetical protein
MAVSKGAPSPAFRFTETAQLSLPPTAVVVGGPGERTGFCCAFSLSQFSLLSSPLESPDPRNR